jgi:hypothetical protein
LSGGENRIPASAHGGVVVGVAGGDHPVVERLQRADRLALGILLAQTVAGHAAVAVALEAVAEQRRPAELAHQRCGELVEGVGEDHQLEALAQPGGEFQRAVEWSEPSDHLLDGGQAQVVLVEDA